MKRLLMLVVLMALVAAFAYAGCNVNSRSGSANATRHHNWIGQNPSNGYYVSWDRRATTKANSDDPGHTFRTSMHLTLGGQVQATGVTSSSWFKRNTTPTTSTFMNTASGHCTVCSTVLNTVNYKDSVWEFDNTIPD